MINNLRTNQFTTYTLSLLLYFLPLWRWIENILLAILIVLFLVSKKKKGLTTNIFLSSAFLFTLFTFLRTLIASELTNDSRALVGLIPTLLIPIAFTIVSKEQLSKALFFLFLGIVSMQLISLWGVADFYFFTEAKKIRLANSSKINEILRFERPYLGFFSALNVILAHYFFKKKKQWYYLIAILLSIAIVVIVSARLGFIIVVLTLVAIFIEYIKKSKKTLISLSVIFVLVAVYLVTQQNSLMQRFHTVKRDSRTIIWQGAINQIKETKNYVFGNGGQNEIREKLLDYYKYNTRIKYAPIKKRFIKQNYNTHNQLLNEFVRGGIVGLLLFLTPFLYLLYKNVNNYNSTAILLLIALLLFCSVENLLERQKGVYLIAIIFATTYKIYEKD